ncbi:hypothetical protein MTR67_003505 [Solanum verrucosum]|uniref:At1g61320/AtMIF1 LRR domain-containing protein n=1 Tax=Solanum verrucosum TaxID=315347 RepID=A0AAF0TE62_SOLVR|nr:hypothetical protein MTR67_003505 [Solanum verrucosum]
MDVLSECVIHKKLSYLSFQESAKLSLVSKTWLQAWLTHPNLEFTLLSSKHGNNIHDRKIVDQVMERYRQTKIPIEKFQLSVTILSLHRPFVFPQMDKWLGIALQNGVKDLSCEVSLPSYPFPIFTFLAPKSLRELVLLGCNLILDHSLSITTTQVISCHSLRKLSLTEVGLDDNMLRALLNCCPLIDDFIIEHCRLLTKKRFKICGSPSVKFLAIENCKGLQEIDAPNLVSLEYNGDQIPELKSCKKVSPTEEITIMSR